MPSSEQNQVDIFTRDQLPAHFAELCNALYERELQALAQQTSLGSSRLQGRLASLSTHIKRAAERLLTQVAPIGVDVQNGSWQSKQAAKCVARLDDKDKTRQWLEKHARLGIPMPVYVAQNGVEHIELDSIDRLDAQASRLHVNKHGWFVFDGTCLCSDKAAYKQLLKPSKRHFSAACCGHSWHQKGRTLPHTLTLRELMLSTSINWKTFR